jgi:hypothetical protein
MTDGKSEACFVEQGDVFVPSSTGMLKVIPTLPAGVFGIEEIPMSYKLQLRRQLDLTVPVKCYGEVQSRSDRILRTFQLRASDSSKPNQSTGVLCVGEKGSGKSLLAKVVSLKAIAAGYPVILISARWKPQALAELLAGVSQPAVVILDELDKLYAEMEDQEGLLSILDGIYNGPRLWLLSANHTSRISRFMINRPSRIYYLFKYTGLSLDVVRSYCESNGLKPEHIKEVVAIASVFSDFNFDMLQGLVEETLRYDQAPSESLKWLNISQNTYADDQELVWEAKVTCQGVVVAVDRFTRPVMSFMQNGVSLRASLKNGKFLPHVSDEEDDDDVETVILLCCPEQLDFSGLSSSPRRLVGKFTSHGHSLSVELLEKPRPSNWISSEQLGFLV